MSLASCCSLATGISGGVSANQQVQKSQTSISSLYATKKLSKEQ